MIDVRDVVVRFPGARRAALDGLDLEVAPGEVVGLLGPNGAGKTTTLRVLAGLTPPRSGRVRVAGVDVVRDPAGARRRVGYLPDFFGVYEDLTCRETLEFFATAAGLRGRTRRAAVEEALALTDLVEKADVLAGTLSRGMRQRLGLARVLVTEPDVLLLDEPASGLDPRARVEVRAVLRELGALGRTVVVSTHVLADVASTCTTLALVHEGRLAFRGTLAEGLRLAGDELTLTAAASEGPAALRAALEAAPTLEGARIEEAAGRLCVRLPLGVALPEAVGPAARGDGATWSSDPSDLAAARVAVVAREAGLHLCHLRAERGDLEGAFHALTRADAP